MTLISSGPVGMYVCTWAGHEDGAAGQDASAPVGTALPTCPTCWPAGLLAQQQCRRRAWGNSNGCTCATMQQQHRLAHVLMQYSLPGPDADTSHLMQYKEVTHLAHVLMRYSRPGPRADAVQPTWPTC